MIPICGNLIVEIAKDAKPSPTLLNPTVSGFPELHREVPHP